MLHSLPDGANVRIGVCVEKLEEEAEVQRIALVRRGRQKQQVVRGVAQEFAQLVAQALVACVGRRHAVRFVNDDQVPTDLPQARQDLLPLGEIERRDDPLLLEPLVDSELISDVVTLEDEELFVELLLQLALPLKSEVGRARDEDAFHQAAQLEFADEKPCHDGLSGASVVRQQEPNTWEL